jgi:hypothetical protein
MLAEVQRAEVGTNDSLECNVWWENAHRTTNAATITTNPDRAAPRNQRNLLQAVSSLIGVYLSFNLSPNQIKIIAQTPMTKSSHRVSGSLLNTSYLQCLDTI